MHARIYVQSVKKRLKNNNNNKKQNILNIFNTNYRRDMKFVPINKDYCLLQFKALKIFLSSLSMGFST